MKKDKGLNEALKELYKALKSETTEEYKKQEADVRKTFEELYKDSSCIIIVTDNGTMQLGNKLDIMTCTCMSIQSLIDNHKITIDDVKAMFESIMECNTKTTEEKLEMIFEKLGE